MRRIGRILLILFCFMVVTSANNNTYCQGIKNNSNGTTITKSTKNTAKNLELKKITFDSNTNKLNLQFSSHCASVKHYYIQKNKIVVDLENCTNKLSIRKLTINKNNITSVRTSQYKNSPKISRVVIDTLSKLPYSISNKDNQVTISFNSIDTTVKVLSTISKNDPSKSNKNNNQPTSTHNITYNKGQNGVIHITSLDVLKDYSQNTEDKTFTFQVDSSYDLSSILNINDSFIKSVKVTKADTFSTVILFLNTAMNTNVSTANSGVNITISNNNVNKQDNSKTKSNSNSNTNRIIVIDPGHGGIEPGSSGNGIVEKNLNLDIALRVKRILESKNIKVYMTRSTDAYMSSSKGYAGELRARAQFANQIKPDFLVSIHTNSSSASSSNGVEVEYYPVSAKNSTTKSLQKGKVNSPKLATYIEDELVKATGAKRRANVSRPNLIILNSSNVVPVLVEVGFLSNKLEAAKLKTEEYKNKVANGIANGILKAYDNN